MSNEAWTRSTLVDLVDDAVGGLWGKPSEGRRQSDETDVLVVRGADFRAWKEHRAQAAAPRRIPTRFLNRRQLRPGDLVLEVSGGGPAQPVGRVLIVDEKAVSAAHQPLICSNFCRKIRLKAGIDPFFVKRQLDWLYRAGHTDQFQTATTNIRNLQVDEFLRGTEIVLPNNGTQKHLSAFLDAAEIKGASSHDHVAAAATAIGRFPEAVFAAACSGRLSADWRIANPQERTEDLIPRLAATRRKALGARSRPPTDIAAPDLPEIPDSWRWLSVDSVARLVVDGVHKTPTYVDRGIPFVTVRNLTAGPGISFESCKFIREEDHRAFTARAKPQRGDILISKDGTLGVTRAIRTDRDFSIFVSVAMIKPALYEMSDYLEIALSSPQVQRQMVGVGSGLVHLVLRDLKADGIPVPPLAEQRHIVGRVNELLALALQLENRVEVAAQRTERVSLALAARAFRGDIGVPA